MEGENEIRIDIGRAMKRERERWRGTWRWR